jgi:VWFA-related protein
MKPTALLTAGVAAWLSTLASAPNWAADLAGRRLLGQTPIGAPRAAERPQQPGAAQGPALRVAVTTVQVDAVVTDRNGRPVTDLRAEDFEILQDGRRQTISTFGYVSAAGDGTPAATVAGRPATPATTPATPATEATPPRASANLASGRTLVVVIDDLSLSTASMRRTKEALHKVVDTQLAPADRVALVRTSGGSGLLQQFTADKAVLHQLVDGLRFNSRQFERDDWQVVADKQRLRDWPPVQDPNAVGGPPPSPDTSLATSWSNEDNRIAERAFGSGAIGTLQTVVAGLRAVPGRKGVLFFSDGFSLTGPTGGALEPMLEQTLHRLIDQATRSQTVIYAINARPWEWMTGADVDMSPNPFNRNEDGIHELDRQQQIRSDQFQQLMEGPAYLASQTGGFFFRNPSDLPLVLGRSLDDQRGYYLLGYAIDQKTMDEDRRARTFHELSVRVTRPGVSVRSRRGFLGGEEPGDPATRLADAASPFGASSLDLRLTGFFAGVEGSQSIVRALVYVDAAGLELTRSTKDKNSATFLELMATLVDERGVVVKRDRQAYRLRASEQTASGGLVYRLDVPVKTPGAYGLRVAAREIATNTFGAANQFVVVPDLRRKRLALSGVVLSASEGPSDDVATGASATHPAIRRFRVPAQLAYSFLVFNARYAPTTSKPSLRALVRLLRDGKPVYTGREVDVRTEAKAGEPINVVSTLSLGPQTSPGDYSLAVTVTDALANEDRASATSIIDFTITGPPTNTP